MIVVPVALTLLLALLPSPPPVKDLSAAQALADVALLRRALETIHPGLERYTPKAELDAAFAALEKRAAGGLTEVEFYVEVSRLLAAIRCDHTKAELPVALETWRETNPSHLPFRFVWIDGRMFVRASEPATGLGRGTEVLSIDGRPVTELRAALEPLVSVDGFTDFVKPQKLSDDSDLMGADFDHFYPLVFGFRGELTMEVRAPGVAEARRVTVPSVSFEAWQKIGSSGSAYRAEFHTSTTWKMLDPQTALLHIGSFVNYRNPVDPATVYGPIFTALQANGAKHLILDLRDNGGGSTDAMLGLLPYLLEAPTAWGKTQRVKNIRFGDLGRVRLVGQATGESAEVPAIRSYLSVTRFQPGLGVTPDIEVPVTLADFLADRDAVLAAARER